MTRVPRILLVLGVQLVWQADVRAQSDEASPAPARLSLSAGVKAWANNWDSWVTSRTGTGVALGTQRFQTVQSVSSEVKVSPIPFISLRHGRFFESVSFMTRTRYTLLDTATPGGFEVNASRREADFSAGYFVLPSLAVTAGYKQLTQTYGPDTYKWRGPILGLGGSGGLGGGWALYGNAAVGFLRATFPATQADSEGRTRFSADYRLGEFGLVYAAAPGGWLRSVVTTVGYRFQNVSTKDYGLAVTDPQGNFTGNVRSNLKDTTQGFALGVTLGF